jgi:protocatechuate 3,4-dioxygenase beta subunit
MALAQPPGKGAISGTVTEPETGDPVRKAIVTLTLQGAPRRWATARTDGSGRFQFDALPPGKYDLRATKGQEGTAIFGAKDVRGLGEVITLGDGETLGGVKLLFLRAASVSGHVYDSDGEPLPGVNVNLLRPGRNLGAPILNTYRGSVTDDRGEYHILNIDPGQYYLRSMVAYGQRFASGSGQPILMDQYYGGALEAKDATAIHVRGGENLAGLDFRLNSEVPVQVRGRVTGVPEDAVPSPIQVPGTDVVEVSGPMRGGPVVGVTLSAAEPEAQRWSNGAGAQGPDFRFQMPDVPAGRYRIEALLHSGAKSYGAFQFVDLHAGSGEILLPLVPAKDLSGTVRFEGPSTSRPNDLRISLARPGGQGANASAQVGADGRFLLKQVPPGEWGLSVNLPPQGFLKSAQLGDKDVRFTMFEVGSGGDASLNIVVSLNTATVEGEIDSESAKRAGIVVAPVTGPYHTLTRFYYGAAADDNGKFKVQGIAPGKYKIFAVEKMADGRFRNPEAIDQLYELGEAIELSEGATLQVKPKLIPMDRAEKAIQ